MKRNIIILVLFFGSVCFGQKPDNNFILSLNFRPSDIVWCTLTIRNINDTNSIELTINKFGQTTDLTSKTCVPLKNCDIDSLRNFFKTYEFKIKTSFDTIYLDTNNRASKGLPKFIVGFGLDGINVDGVLMQNNIERKFAFWSPRKESENNKLMKIIFTLLYKSFTKEKEVNYIEQLEDYFELGIGLKKISEIPLKYKLYGTISSDYDSEIADFINNLPSDKEIYIDMSNFNGMGTMFYPLFKSLIKRNKKVLWVNPTKEGLRQLKEIGVNKKHIIN